MANAILFYFSSAKDSLPLPTAPFPSFQIDQTSTGQVNASFVLFSKRDGLVLKVAALISSNVSEHYYLAMRRGFYG